MILFIVSWNIDVQNDRNDTCLNELMLLVFRLLHYQSNNAPGDEEFLHV